MSQYTANSTQREITPIQKTKQKWAVHCNSAIIPSSSASYECISSQQVCLYRLTEKLWSAISRLSCLNSFSLVPHKISSSTNTEWGICWWLNCVRALWSSESVRAQTDGQRQGEITQIVKTSMAVKHIHTDKYYWTFFCIWKKKNKLPACINVTFVNFWLFPPNDPTGRADYDCWGT